MKSHGDTPTRQSEVLHNAISSGHTEPGAEHSPSQPPTRPGTASSSHDTVVGSDSFGTRYEIAERLGAGGMGAVYKAFDRELKRTVAIKRIRPELLARPHARQRFDQEAQAVATLNHPNIVQIFDRGTDAHGPFLVMEFIGGPSLADRLASGKPLELDETVRIASALCDALQAAHDKGVLHRDVKPANVLFSEDGTPKLTDFGLARLETPHEVTQAGAVFGTPFYISPEQQLDASTVTHLSDQWSLAATIYHMVTGELPRRIMERRIPEIIRDVLIRATEENAATRYRSILHFKEALQAAWSKPSSNRFVEENVSSDAVETLKRQIEKVRLTHEAARRQAYEQHDWGQAKNTLDTLHEDVRDAKLYEEVALNARIVTGLTESIATATRQLQWYGLNLAIEELAKLQPHRTDLVEMPKLLEARYVIDARQLRADVTMLDRLSATHPALALTPVMAELRRSVDLQLDNGKQEEERRKFVEGLDIAEIRHNGTYRDLETISHWLRLTPMEHKDRQPLDKAYNYAVKSVISAWNNVCQPMFFEKRRATLIDAHKEQLPPECLHAIAPGKGSGRDDAIAGCCVGLITLPLVVGVFFLIGGFIFYRRHRETVRRLRLRYPTEYGIRIDESELWKIIWWKR